MGSRTDEERGPAGVRGLIQKLFQAVGPGLITAAVVLGPGSITVSSKCGAEMGYDVLWAVVVAVVLMIAYTQMGARIGLAGKGTFLDLSARVFGRWASVVLGLCGFLIATGFQTGNNVGVGVAMEALTGGPVWLWAAIFTLVALVVMWTSSSVYQLIERIMAALVALMIVCFFGDVLMIRPRFGELALGFVPSRPAVFALLVPLSATTFSVAAAAFQSYLVQAKGWSATDLRKGMRDVVFGIITLGTISCVIMITSATVLRPAGLKVTSALDMARQLEPLLGPAAKWLFLLGLWAGAFSSFIVNALLGGTFLADSLGLGNRVQDWWPRMFASAVMVLGTVVTAFCKGNPIQLLIVAQATTIVGVPFIALAMILIASRRNIMGDTLRNGPLVTAVALAGLLWLTLLSGFQIMRFVAMASGGG